MTRKYALLFRACLYVLKWNRAYCKIMYCTAYKIMYCTAYKYFFPVHFVNLFLNKRSAQCSYFVQQFFFILLIFSRV
jgi:hypothetical protein